MAFSLDDPCCESLANLAESRLLGTNGIEEPLGPRDVIVAKVLELTEFGRSPFSGPGLAPNFRANDRGLSILPVATERGYSIVLPKVI